MKKIRPLQEDLCVEAFSKELGSPLYPETPSPNLRWAVVLNVEERRHLLEAAPPCWGAALIEAPSWSPPATAAPPS